MPIDKRGPTMENGRVMTRRGFLGRLLYVGVIARAAAFCQRAPSPSIGGIDHATYKFWRNQDPPNPNAFDNFRTSFHEVYNQCSDGAPSSDVC
jgi:hypothetical protein